ncbi:condensation domain-containing protein [Streptomyces sp. NBC_00564]|uniref:condensation domain-containing protein n=1 Tax=Streptomyces sp. NBC_00564 TaxID=2903663 RepID=UPI00352D525A|nr:condensation domain-containing protein [Streptomyces sp. NBC_00564]
MQAQRPTAPPTGQDTGRAAAGPPRPSSRPVIGRAQRTQALELSAGQQQMWVLHQLDPRSPAYTMTWALRLAGRLDPDALRWSWEQVVERHEILRTRYTQDGDEPTQIIDPPTFSGPRIVDISRLPSALREDRAQQIAEWEALRPFDLTAEHPLRVTLVVLGPDLHVLVIHLHHIACDGPSYQRLAAEFGALYAARTEGRTAGLPALDVQYADYAVWENTARRDGTLRPQLAYWARTLGGLKELPLPLDRPRPAASTGQGGSVDIVIGAETAAGVQALAAAHRASPFMVLLAAYQALLASVCRTDDVAVGVPVSARTVPELDELVGYTINTVVVRSDPHDGDTFAQLLDRVRERFLDALDHRAVPFKWVVDEVNPVRDTSRNPLFQVCFDMNAAAQDAVRLPGLDIELLRLTSPAPAKFDLNLHIEESGAGQWHGRLDFAAEVIDQDTARHWADCYTRLLEAVLRDPQEALVKAHDRLGAAGSRPQPDGRPTSPETPAATPTVAGARRDSLLGRIRQVWCEVLNTDHVDVRDNFFDVGGDSLRAIALAGRLRAQGLTVSSTDVFRYQTVEELAGFCADGPAGPTAPQPAAPGGVAPFALLRPEDRAALPPGVVDAYPVTAMQLGMLAELQSQPHVNTYQDTTSYRIRGDGDFDTAALQEAAQLVVSRHEVLRTSFDLNSYSEPLQLVHADAKITVRLSDHGTLGPQGWAPRVRAHAAVERNELMDISYAPLIRVHAHTATDSPDWWITIAESHPILEGWSFHTLLMEILLAYRDIRAGQVPAEPEPAPLRFADYVAAELAAGNSPDHRNYWRSVLEGRSDVSLPAVWQDAPQAPRERYFVALNFHDLEADLRRLASQTRTSMKAVLLTAHLKVMSRVARSERFFTGLVCDARPETAGAERVLGNYLNTVPVAMPEGARTWGELVTAVYDTLTELWPHRVVPIQVIQRDHGAGRLLEVFFNYLDFHQVDQNLVEWKETFTDSENEFALHVYTISGQLRLNTTNHSLSKEAAHRLSLLYRDVLQEMALGPDGDTDAASLPPREAEPARVPAVRRDPRTALHTVPAAFADGVRERPDAVALRQGTTSLTYAQLDDEAARIAHGLQQAGVGTGDLVAVMPGHTPATLAALLAVWQAGAAWVLRNSAHEDDGAPAVSAIVVPSAAQAQGVAHGTVPVITAHPGEEAADAAGLPRQQRVGPGGTALPRPQDTACVVRAGEGADASWAVFTHQALAAALDSDRAALEVSAGPAPHGAGWLSASALPTWQTVSELLLPLVCAGSVVLTRLALPDCLPEIRQLLASRTVTHLHTTSLVAEALHAGGPAPEGITAFIGGARRGPGRPAAPGNSVRLIPAEAVDALPGWVTFLGRPLPGRPVRLLDSRLLPAPVGVAAELCVGGPGLPDACYGDPAATAARLVPDAFGESGARLLRTGQLARYAADGTVELLGPIDPPADAQGDPVETYRIRELLDAQPLVRDSVVLRHSDPEGQTRTIGYVRTVAEGPSTADEVWRGLAARRLSRYLVPDALVEVDGWPLTADGSVALDRLPAPADRPQTGESQETDWDDTFQELITEALSDHAPGTVIRPDQPLTDVGLDSLRTIRLLLALENAYDITITDEVPVIDMFRTPRTLWEEVSRLRRRTP